MKRFLLGLIAVGLLLAANLLLNRAAPVGWSVGAAGPGVTPVPAQALDLLLLLGAALLLLALALRGGQGAVLPFRIGQSPAAGAGERGPTGDGFALAKRVERAGWLCMAAALGLSLAAAPRFAGMEPKSGAWTLHLMALYALLTGSLLLSLVWRLAGEWGTSSPADRHRAGWAGAALLALTLVALVLRVWQNEAFPAGIWFDEAENALIARDLLTTPRAPGSSFPLFLTRTYHTAHYNYLLAAAFALWGDSIAVARLVSAILGALLVPATWLAAYELFRSDDEERTGRVTTGRITTGRITTGRITTGQIVAWLAALLVVGAAWSLNLSRIAVNYNATPLFAVAAVGLLLHGLRTQRLGAWLGAGLAVGLGINFYSSFRLFVPVLPIFVVVALLMQGRAGGRVRPMTESLAALRASNLQTQALWRGLLLATLAALVVSAPLITFALANPAEFLKRSSETWLLAGVEGGERVQKLLENARTHLFMFNVKGDPNARHNLPGRPMLDPLLGALFVPGLLLSLWRLREPRHLLLLLWLGFTLLGGILTLDFEAPQSLRANGALPAALLIALVPVAALLRVWERGPGRHAGTRSPAVMSVLAAAVAVPALLWNLTGYFRDQRNDFAVWNEFSMPDTLIGQRLATLNPQTTDAWVIATSVNQPAGNYLAPQWRGLQRPLLDTDPLPMAWTSGRDAWIFLGAESYALLERLRLLYPNAEYIENRAPMGDAVVSTHVHLTAEEIERPRGLTLTYASGTLDDASGTLDEDAWRSPTAFDALPILASERTVALQANWSAPVTGVMGAPGASPFVAQWQGVLRTAFGPHTFVLEAPARATLFLDETPVLQSGTGPVSTTLTLADGPHLLRLVAEGGAGPLSLRWIPPGPTETPAGRTPFVPAIMEPVPIPPEAMVLDAQAVAGLAARFVPLPEVAPGAALLEAGEAALAAQRPISSSGRSGAYEFISARVAVNFHVAPVVPPLAAEWTGKLIAPVAGDYLLALTASDAVRVEVDGEPLFESETPETTSGASLYLDAGLHDIRVLFVTRGPFMRLSMEWAPPGGGRSPVPSQLLLPPLGDYSIMEARLQDAETLLTYSGGFVPLAQPESAQTATVAVTPELVLDGLGRPTSVAVGPDGRIYIAESGAGGVRILSEDGTELATISEADGPLVEPFDLALTPEGNLLLLDAGRPALLLLDADGNLIRALPVDASWIGRSRGLAVGADGSIWIANTPGSKLVVLLPEGELLAEFPAAEGEDVQPVDVLTRPAPGDASIIPFAEGAPRLYATVLGVNQGILYDETGVRLGGWPLPAASSMEGPHLAAGPAGLVYVTVPEEGRVEVRFVDGSPLMAWQLPLTPRVKPVGIAVAPDGAIYLTDTEQGALWRIQQQQ